jgi:hypothetical protein
MTTVYINPKGLENNFTNRAERYTKWNKKKENTAKKRINI